VYGADGCTWPFTAARRETRGVGELDQLSSSETTEVGVGISMGLDPFRYGDASSITLDAVGVFVVPSSSPTWECFVPRMKGNIWRTL
jgi:hypothetical protein